MPLVLQTGTAVYGTVRTVVWEGGRREAAPYPISLHSGDVAVWHKTDIARCPS